jgi:hypothetical protein
VTAQRDLGAAGPHDAGPTGRKLSGAGHYHELYLRQDGEWRIAESRLTRLWLEMTPEGI